VASLSTPLQSQNTPPRSPNKAIKVLLWSLPAILLIGAFYLFDMPMVRSDGLAYYAWLDSLVSDGDLVLENQYRALQKVNLYHLQVIEATGRVGTPFPFGSAFLWAPLYALGLWLEPVLPLADWFRFLLARILPMEGYESVGLIRGLLMTLGTNAMALLTVYLALDIARRRTSLGMATLAALAVAFGTPFFYYSALEPTMSHIPGALTVTVIFWLFFPLRAGSCATGAAHRMVLYRVGTGLGYNGALAASPHRHSIWPDPSVA